MKKNLLIGFCLLSVLFGCTNPNNDDNQNIEDGHRYSQGLWGEWIRMDTGEVWRITAEKVAYIKADASGTVDATASVTLRKDPAERVIEVTEGARTYYLYASRTATGKFTGSIANEAGGSSSIIPPPPPNANVIDGIADGPLFSFAAADGVTVSARNLKDSANTVETKTNEYGEFAIEGIIPGDEYELRSGGQTAVVRPSTDGSDVGTVTLTDGLNFKTSVSPADDTTDMALLFAKRGPNDTETVYRFNIDVHNTGTEDCLVAVFSLDADDGLTILERPSNRILGTIEPGAKKTIPVTVSCDTPEAAAVLKKIYIAIDGVGKRWKDAVSLRFHKTAVTYYFASASQTQGIVIAPDAKTYHFKTALSSFNGAYTTTVTMPWSEKDYLVVFSGATIDTETSYSFNANAAPNTDYESDPSYALADESANDREKGATIITTNEGATGYLHKGDIDYYKVRLGEITPESGGGGGTDGVPAFDAPANLRATGTVNGITLTWTGLSGSTKYEVHRSAGDTTDWSLITTVNAPAATYSDTAVTFGTVYYYKVCAVNASGTKGSFSGTVYGQKAPLAIPANFKASTITTASITVSWDAVSSASSYYIYRSASFNGDYTEAAVVSTGTTYTDTGLEPDTAYFYKIRAYTASNGGYHSGYSGVLSTATDGVAGLYKGAAYATAVKINTSGSGLLGALDYISSNAVSGDNYYIVLGDRDSLTYLPPRTLDYSNKTVGITLMSDGSTERVVQVTQAPPNTNNTLFAIKNGVTLTLENNVTLKNRDGIVSVLITIDNAAFIMKGGKISSTQGVSVSYNATFTMSGGEIICNNTINDNMNRAVGLHGSSTDHTRTSFTMSGGKISGFYNIYNGGGVNIGSYSTFTMSGGEISGNKSVIGGGGVLVGENAIFTMSGGKINGNRVDYGIGVYGGGGGVWVAGGTFTMSGGEISGNTISGDGDYGGGGGVCVGRNSTFTMTGGKISGNTANSIVVDEGSPAYGGGVFVYDTGIFTKSSTGGVITGSNDTSANRVTHRGSSRPGRGSAVYVNSTPVKKLENTVSASKGLDSRTDGQPGGWTE